MRCSLNKRDDLDQDKAWQRYRNRQSNGFGKNFEKFVEMGCKHYRDIAVADITKVDEPFRVIRLKKNGRFEGQFTKKANPDFEGTLKGGISICFECKYTSKDRIQQSVITKKQAEVLNMKYRLGGLVAVCCCINNRFFFVPWKFWKDFDKCYGKKSFTVDDLAKYEVSFRNGVMFLEKYLLGEIKSKGDYYMYGSAQRYMV